MGHVTKKLTGIKSGGGLRDGIQKAIKDMGAGGYGLAVAVYLP